MRRYVLENSGLSGSDIIGRRMAGIENGKKLANTSS
jgi:hypothetical protein